MKKLFIILGLSLSFIGCTSTIKGSELAWEYYNLGNAYYELENYSKAVLFLQKAVDLDGEFRKAW